MIAVVGDLVEDIVVRLGGPVRHASDTGAAVIRRRGGSAANVAVSVARSGHPARFIGQVGDDPAGSALIDTLVEERVEVIARRAGRTGTIVVLLDEHGERTMLTDRGASTGLDHPQSAWLDQVDLLHVPLYSLIGEPLARTTTALITWAHRRRIRVSIDASSAGLIEDFGADEVLAMISDLHPEVLLCNALESEALGPGISPEILGTEVTVVKRGREPAVVLQAGEHPIEVPVAPIAHVADTTGAGDAFAAGFLIGLVSGASPIAATSLGHQTATRAIVAASGP